MKKKLLTSALLIIIFSLFSLYLIKNSEKHEVLEVYSPLKFAIDLNNNKRIDSDEVICIPEIKTFSMDVNQTKSDFIPFNFSDEDRITLGYLANEFAQNLLLNKYVKVSPIGEVSSECTFANIENNNLDYADIFLKSGYAIKNGEILNAEKFEQNLQQARNLHLVILNHHSNKYHKLDCKYGRVAHDMILIPYKHLPKGAKPCKYCHNVNQKLKKDILSKSNNIPSPQLVHSFGNITMYYTDYTKHLKPDNNCNTSECRAFVNLVNLAKKSIDIAIYGYDDIPAITSALKEAKKRGVIIRFVYDSVLTPGGEFYKGNNIISSLADSSINDKNSKEPNSIMHNKFIVFDKQKVFTGSMNFSKSGLSGYDVNNTIIINSADVASLYLQEFEQMLSGKFHNEKSKLNLPNKFVLGDTILEIYFSPKDKTTEKIIEIIKKSNKYIYIPAFLITYNDISNELISAHKRGVDVRIILDANSTNTRNIKYKILRTAGIPLKFENYAGKLHSKTMIIDDEYIVMGSMNFSNSGENKNDENTVILKNNEFAKEYKNFFLYLWKVIPDKYLKRTLRAESPESIGSCSDGVDNNFNGLIDSFDNGCMK